MKRFVLGFLILAFFLSTGPSRAQETLYLRGFVPPIQRLEINRSLNGLNMRFKRNFKGMKARLTLIVKRQGQNFESREITSDQESVHFFEQQNHPIQTITLVQQ